MADPSNPAEVRFGKIDDIKSRVAAAIDASRRFLFSIQDREDGYWCGELGADTTLVSDYILLHRLLGTEDAVRTQKCARRNSESAESKMEAGRSTTMGHRISAPRLKLTSR